MSSKLGLPCGFFIGLSLGVFRCVPAAEIVVDQAGPVQSPAVALQMARRMRKEGVVATNETITVRFSPGHYRLSSTLVLNPEDSNLAFVGSSEKPVVFDGGRLLPQFHVRSDGLWESRVGKGVRFDQLWVNGCRAQRARSPNHYYHYMREESLAKPRRKFRASREDIACLSTLSEEELRRVVIQVWQSWSMSSLYVQAVDFKSGWVEGASDASWELFHWRKFCPRYIIENCRTALDAPGEWFLDERAGIVIYMPREGESAETSTACRPALERLVEFKGDRGNQDLVNNVSFRNISFVNSGCVLPTTGRAAWQAAKDMRVAAVCANGIENVSFVNCRLAHTGAHGLWFANGCRHVEIRHCLIEDLGGGGVYVGDDSWDQKSSINNNAYVTVSDSIIREGGRVQPGGVGVWIGHAADCLVVHNNIYDFFYTGVSFGWTWGYSPTCCRNNRIVRNRIYRIGQGRLSDMGGVYALGRNEGSEVVGNWISDVAGYPSCGAPSFGLYLDQGSSDIVLASNLVERCRDGAVHQHYGRNNVFRNNIFTGFDQWGVWTGRCEPHEMYRLEHNIFWWENPMAGALRCADPKPFGGRIPADGNVFWCANGPVANYAFGNEAWDAWRKKGYEEHGLVADPCFCNPKAGDWSLSPNSPVFGAGFVAFDWREAGVLKKDPRWVARAQKRTWKECKPAPEPPFYECPSVALDDESLPFGSLGSHHFNSPFWVRTGSKNAISVVTNLSALGKKALRCVKSPENSVPFTPHLVAWCDVSKGTARISFAIDVRSVGPVDFESRQYYKDAHGHERIAVGARFTFRDGGVWAEGRRFAVLRTNEWSTVDFRIKPGEQGKGVCWEVTVTGSDGPPQSFASESWVDANFRAQNWIGFMTWGAPPQEWYLDNFRFERVDVNSNERHQGIQSPSDAVGSRSRR